jgi:hypothetical protein
MNNSTGNPLENLLAFLDRLESSKIWYRLWHVRDSVMVMVPVPGERWEIEFFADGSVEVERFISTGKIESEETFDELFRRYDPSNNGQ